MKLSAMIVATALLGTAGQAAAHHSYAGFNRNAPTTIEGELVRADWRNPHVTLIVRTDAGTEYEIIWHGIARMTRYGLPESPFRTGDRLVLTGAAAFDDESRQMTLMQEIARPADGWVWRNPGAEGRDAGRAD